MGYSHRHLQVVSGLVAMLREEADLAGEDLPGIPREEHLRTRRRPGGLRQPSLKLAVDSPERDKYQITTISSDAG